jgi:DNA polymerase-3 subunit alpha
VKERKANGKYTNFIDFCERIANDTVNKKCIECLIKVGAFDEIEKDLTRYDLLENYETIIDSIVASRRKNYENQISIFETAKADDTSTTLVIKKSGRAITKKEILDMEKELLGIYVSGHPLDEYIEYIKKNSTVNSSDLNQLVEENEFDETTSNDENIVDQKQNYDGKEATICGIISSSKLLYTKNNRQMMFATLEDIYGSIEIVVFPTVFVKYSGLLKNDNIVKVKGKISLKENEKAKILVDEISGITKSSKIYIKIPTGKEELENIVIENIKQIANDNQGNTPVYLFYEGTNKVKMLNREYWLDANDSLIKLLGFKFGTENVKEVEK